jgi:uncharacterized protein YuzE
MHTMSTSKLRYYAKEDILHLVRAEGHEADSVELSPTITAELNDQGEVIGVEVLEASTFVHDALLALVQAQHLPGHSAGTERREHPTGASGTRENHTSLT